ncbi:E3 ubiquitin-protein ligase Bre1p [[Candida] anglica]|uniref:E3 ubiquitin protein ligase n=1 Tax=[Candida] anglica TaxID=148631 RepID=A0ABP0E8C2_9ASCO
METNKRGLESNDTVSNKKRKPLDELSEDGPLTQEDVVYFQKEAIWRQMVSYKRQCSYLARDLRSFKQKYQMNEDKLNILDAWYEQIISVLGQDSGEVDSSESSLLVSLSNLEKDGMDDILQKRRNQLISILKPLIDNGKLNYPEKSELIDKIENLTGDLCQLKAEKQTISKIKEELEVNIEQLRESLVELGKETDRKQSKTLGRVDVSMANSKEEKGIKEESNNQDNNNNKISSGSNINSTTSEVSISKEEVEKFETLKISIKELEVCNEKLKENLEIITKKHMKSSEDCLELASRLANLNQTDLCSSPIYNNLTSINKKLNEQLGDSQKSQEILIKKLNELEETKTMNKSIIDQQLIGENENLKSQLNKSEADLVRIRTSRDELLGKISVLKSDQENKQLISELTKLIDIQKERILNLEKDKNEINPIQDEIKLEKLKSLTSEELIKRIFILDEDIKEIEKAFQDSRDISQKKLMNEIETENMIKKLSVEKTKADQKYFAAMRSKDALSSENRILKSQVLKSQELVSKLTEMEKVYLNKIEILTKSSNDFKSIKENSIQENSKLQEQIKTIISTKEKQENELKYLKNKFEIKSKQFNELEIESNEGITKVAKLESRLKETETLLKKYRANNTSSILQEDEKQLEAFRAIAKCSVCSKNWKDTAITVCGHVFCQDCAQERLAARLRRCPTCNKGFSANDLLSIHL